MTFFARSLVGPGSNWDPAIVTGYAKYDGQLKSKSELRMMRAAAGRWRSLDDHRYRRAVDAVCNGDDGRNEPLGGRNRPASRAYGKLWEIIEQLPIAPRVWMSAHLGEAPGGFVQALADVGKNQHSRVSLAQNWRYVAVSLPAAVGGLDWRLSERDLRACVTGDPIDADLLDDSVRDRLVQAYGGQCQIVTADGGFEVDYEKTTQECASLDLIRREFELAMALLDQRCADAACVIKVFDTENAETQALVADAAMRFDRAWIVKPRSSRIVNAERYFVGAGVRNRATTLLCVQQAQAAFGARQCRALAKVGDLLQSMSE